jgi:dTDP-4-amino-4,6-dideoxygalactose transaminase
LSDLDYGPEEEAAALRVLRGKWLSQGPEVQAFEREFAAHLEVKHAVAVANGTAALHLAYLALGLGPGDEVVQPAVNFVAAANMAVAIGAVPVFADIHNPDEPTLDPADLERRLTPRTRAVVVMHYGGYPCRMAEIVAVCRERGLAVIEDACHAVGARYLDPLGRAPHGQRAGALGDIACFSFFSNKNLAVGEGGMITTDREDLAARLRLLRSHGMTTLTWDRHQGHASSYDVVAHGYNYRLDELRAALGRCQLRKLEGNNARRKELVLRYRERLVGLPGWVIPFGRYPGDSAYHLMAAVAPDGEVRKRAVSALKEAGIQTSFHYPRVDLFAGFAGCRQGRLEQSQTFHERAITLPLYPTLAPAQVDEITGVVRKAAGCPA